MRSGHRRALAWIGVAVLCSPLAGAGALDPCEGCAVDLNHDGALTQADIDLFEFAHAALDPLADFTGNGVIDALDRTEYLAAHAAACGVCPQAALDVPIVFVSRAINPGGTAHWSIPRDMPGVGPWSRTRPAPPGRLLVREADGSVRTLIDGANPGPASLDLIDVNAPAVSYDGAVIAFAGLPAGDYDGAPGAVVDGWRIYTIRADGSDLRQVTFSDQDLLDYSQFGAAAAGLRGYDDFDPVFLPDGRICFASTRWPSFAHYDGARTSNLHVVNTDGSRLIRITAERNGAERPLVDPLTGNIVYFRWWRNHRFPINDFTTIEMDPLDPGAGFIQHGGLTINQGGHIAAPSFERNHWQVVHIRTDGGDLALFSGAGRDEAPNHAYGGGFDSRGALFANFFPMMNMTDAGGFGGVIRLERGVGVRTALIGVTDEDGAPVLGGAAPSTGVLWGRYAAEPEPLPDGRIVLSWAPNIHQDYGLYTFDPATGAMALVWDEIGASEVRARALTARTVPPIGRDTYRDDPSESGPPLLPPAPGASLAPISIGLIYPLNVYANADVDVDIVSAPPVGSAETFIIYVDHQRTSPGTAAPLDWPILALQQTIEPDGSIIMEGAPVGVPVFEQIRGPAPGFELPTTGGHETNGAAQVAGHNFILPGSSLLCIGCHAGHSLMSTDVHVDDAVFSNVAPGAAVTASSWRTDESFMGLIDRRVLKGAVEDYWSSAPGETVGQWVDLSFPVPVSIRGVRVYAPRTGEAGESTVDVGEVRIRLFTHENAAGEIARATLQNLTTTGSEAPFDDLLARSVRVEIINTTGDFLGAPAAALGEIEVIARGEHRTAIDWPAPPPGDVNFDGAITAADLALLLGAWGTHTPPAADINADGAVTAADLALLLGAWGD